MEQNNQLAKHGIIFPMDQNSQVTIHEIPFPLEEKVPYELTLEWLVDCGDCANRPQGKICPN